MTDSRRSGLPGQPQLLGQWVMAKSAQEQQGECNQLLMMSRFCQHALQTKRCSCRQVHSAFASAESSQTDTRGTAQKRPDSWTHCGCSCKVLIETYQVVQTAAPTAAVLLPALLVKFWHCQLPSPTPTAALPPPALC